MLHFFLVLAPEVERESQKQGEGSISPVKRSILITMSSSRWSSTKIIRVFSHVKKKKIDLSSENFEFLAR
jgi:hypothetical protein